MDNTVDVQALADLARIEVTNEELAEMERDIPAILAFVEQIQEVSGDASSDTPTLENVMREDGEPHESGIHTEALLKTAPKRRDNYVQVGQVVKRDRSA